jgi:transposase InsO family protein
MRSVLTLLFDVILVMVRILKPGGRSWLLAEYLLVRQQLIAVRRKHKQAPKLTSIDRIVLALSSLFINSKRLPKISIVVAHSTMLGFHRALVNRKYSKLFSNKFPKKPGPKGPSAELIKLIVGIKVKNPRYGCPKIALLASELLGECIDEQMVRRILRKHFSSQPRGPGPSWLNAIGIAKDVLWSVDLFCCESICLQTHWVMVVMDHYTREIIGVAVIKGSPTGVDVCRMFAGIRSGSGRSPRHLSSDHDPLFKFHRWIANLSILDIDEIKTVPETPWSHPYIERVIGTIRREYLDETLFWNERDLLFKLKLFTNYYNEARVHSSIQGKTPRGRDGGGAVDRIDLGSYGWKSYCNGRFSIPIAA